MQSNEYGEISDLKKQKKKLKIIILSVFTISLLAVIIYYIVLNFPEKKSESTDYADALTDYEFYAVLDENIFEDEDYTEEMRKIYFSDLTDGIKEYILTEENITDFDASVNFMYDYVNYIINGDEENYNACFSDAYYEKVYSKSDFTMQRLYDIELSKVSETYEGGLKVYIFKLDYKILKNDGTFRRDIDSSTSRTKTIYVTNREGRLAIDGEVILHIQYNEKY